MNYKNYKDEGICLIQGDCLEVLQQLVDSGVKVDAVICDPPYGTSACKWDTPLDLTKLWELIRKLKRDNTVPVVIFGSQPFTTTLISSNIKEYKYSWVWEKENATNFLNKNYQCGKVTEDIVVFGTGATSFSKKGIYLKYNPQLSEGKPYEMKNDNIRSTNAVIRSEIKNVITKNNGTRLPNNILKFNRDKDKVHPTQKPTDLMEYLVRTYTDESGIVLDFTMGSGSTGVACKKSNRKFIGIELKKEYFDIAVDRIENLEV